MRQVLSQDLLDQGIKLSAFSRVRLELDGLQEAIEDWIRITVPMKIPEFITRKIRCQAEIEILLAGQRDDLDTDSNLPKGSGEEPGDPEGIVFGCCMETERKP